MTNNLTLVEFMKNISSNCKNYLATPSGKVWILVKVLMYWENAFNVCNSYGGYLARVRNQAEANALYNLAQRSGVWISLKSMSSIYHWYDTYVSASEEQVLWWPKGSNPLSTGPPRCWVLSRTGNFWTSYCQLTPDYYSNGTVIPGALMQFVCEIPNPSIK